MGFLTHAGAFLFSSGQARKLIRRVSMKTPAKEKVKTSDPSKIVTVNILFVLSIAISLSGAFFCVYSLLNGVSFRVINTDVPGVLFGVVVLYLGIRYFLSVLKLRREVYGTNARFDWNNFRLENLFPKKDRKHRKR
jgi:hypothetical protein